MQSPERTTDNLSSMQGNNGSSHLQQSHLATELKLDIPKVHKTTSLEQSVFFPSPSLLYPDGQNPELWAEVKIRDKNIQKRCYHISFIYNGRYLESETPIEINQIRFYVHGGYEMNTGRLSDFHYIEIREDLTLGKWQKVEAVGDLKPSNFD